MNKLSFIVLSILLTATIGLAGCNHSDSVPDQNQSQKNNENSSADDSSSQGQKSSDSETNHTTPEDQADSSDLNSGKPDQSTDSKGQSISDNNDSDQNEGSSADTPHSTDDAIKAMMANVHVSFRMMMADQVPVDDNMYLTGTTQSSQYHYDVNLMQTSEPTAINSDTLKNTKTENKRGTISGTYYASTAKAAKQINTISQDGNQPNVNLGHGIKAYSEGATGHAYMTWHEGSWQITMNSPTDSHYAIRGKSRKPQKKLAKEVVNYLEDHMLPAPHNKGKITISTWKNDPTTTVKWQEEKTIYQIETQKPAMDALKMAVSMKSFS